MATTTTNWLAPAIVAEAFDGTHRPCHLVYAGDVDDPPDPDRPDSVDWDNFDEGKCAFAVGLDWLGGPVGKNVPLIVRYAGRRSDDGNAPVIEGLVALLKRLGYTNVRAERATK